MTVRFGSNAAALMSAQNEAVSSRAAWHAVAPADGLLPASATPIQRLLYTRMITSDFIFRMAKLRAVRSPGGAGKAASAAA